ncbi:metallophosphoesterase [Caldithrix abyssi DSM 13497]|uniref:Metallophosphoesterase n=1 Tax=Caldithrix abyssi DSM 13497 TaxID=880073 RepID=H1XSV7_CALAY|nr:metallophosphoesterase [Caldithrix abyssi]EHO40334.1 metallophosphoesterase [Caldithrix abyssi DSM 13497]
MIKELSVLSDLHLPHANLAKIRLKIEVEESELILFAGDVLDAFDEKLLQEFLQTFADLPQPKLLVLGNHDLWQDKPHTDALYEDYLQFPWQEYGFHLLDKEPIIFGNTAFCGNMGWYDYSLRLTHDFDWPVIACDELLRWETMNNDEIRNLLQTAATKSFKDLNESDFARKILLVQNNGRWESLHWYDRLYINWGKSDQEMTAYFLHRLEEQLQETRGLEQVVVLHHAPILPRLAAEGVLDAYLSAFNGSKRFWDLICQYDVKTVIHGHLHRKAVFTWKNVRVYSCYGLMDTIRI